MAKMLCIFGRQHPVHTGLVAGQVYEVTYGNPCCRIAAYAEGSEFYRPTRVRCKKCGRKHVEPKLVPWGPWRFIPWNAEIEKEIINETTEDELVT